MKILIIECDAEEMRANRTIIDAVTDTLNCFMQSIAGVNIPHEAVTEAIKSEAEEQDEAET